MFKELSELVGRTLLFIVLTCLFIGMGIGVMIGGLSAPVVLLIAGAGTLFWFLGRKK